MTALQAAGGGLPLGLHIPHVVEQAGSLAGFAAVIGLAVLSALYFSQARDLRRLREWAGRAPERAAEIGTPQAAPVPGRVVAVPQRAPQAAAAAPGATAAPAAKPANGAPAPAQPSAATPTADAEADKAAATNGDSAPNVSAAPGAGEQKGDAAGVQSGAAKPGMPGPASAAAAAAGATAAAAAGAGAASASGPAAPPASGPGAQGPEAAGQAAPAAGQSGAPPAASAGSPAAPPAPTGAAASPGPAAAAAGAGAAGAARATPQRPPGSVLPPRTGTLPPVRRLPSSNVGAGQTGVPGQAPPQKKKRNPLYVALAVAGVLVIGAAAAIGVPALVNGAKNDKSSKKTATTAHRSVHSKSAAATSPSKITVAVLNGTSINGLAASIGDRVESEGFTKGTVSNAPVGQGQRANSVVMYAKGHASDARLVARRLKISSVEAIDSSTQQIAGDATVVVLVGSDKTQ